MSSYDPPAVQEMDQLLKAFVPDQAIGTPGGDLKTAILNALNDAERRGQRRQGMVIMAAIRGDLTADEDCAEQWNNRHEYEAELAAS